MQSRGDAFPSSAAARSCCEEVLSQFDGSDLWFGQGGHHVWGYPQHSLSLRVCGDRGWWKAQHVLSLDPKIGRRERDAASRLGLHAELSCNSHLEEIGETAVSNQESTSQKQSKIFQQDVCSCGNGSSTMLTLVSPTLSHLLDDILAGYILDDCGRGGACSRTAWRAGCWFYSRTGRCRQSCHCDARLSYHRAPRSLHLHWAGLGFYRQSHHSLRKDKEAACEQINTILTDFLSRDLRLASSMDFLLQCTI